MTTAPKRGSVPSWIIDNIPQELIGTTLFRFKIKLQVTDDGGRKEVEVNLLPDLDLDYERLEDQMQELPAQYAFWSAVYSEARLAVGLAERKLKIRRSQAAQDLSSHAAETGVRVSAEQAKILIEANEDLVAADMNLQSAQMKAGKLYHMLEALKMKAELARSLAGFKKQEQGHH